MKPSRTQTLLRRSRRAFLRIYRRYKKCEYCGASTQLVFHHRDPITRYFVLGTTGPKHSWQLILNEIDKCQVVCRSCHSRIHRSTRINVIRKNKRGDWKISLNINVQQTNLKTAIKKAALELRELLQKIYSAENAGRNTLS